MAHIRPTNFVSGRLTSGPTGTGAFTMTSADGGGAGTDGLSLLPAVTSGDTCFVVLDPQREFGDPEVIEINTHTASATTADVQAGGRGLHGTTARSHVSGTKWVWGLLDYDLDIIDAKFTAYEVSTAPAVLNPDETQVNGVSSAFARADHAHSVPTAAPVATGSVLDEGASTSFARADHVHTVGPNTIGDLSQFDGTGDARPVNYEIADLVDGDWDGQIKVTTDTRVIEVWDQVEDVWREVFPIKGRIGCTLSRSTNQSINNSTGTNISWTTEGYDPDGFIAVTGTSITIPAGFGGIYDLTVQGVWASSGSYDVGLVPVVGGVQQFPNLMSNIYGSCSHSLSGIPLADLETLQVQAFQSSGGALNLTSAVLHLYRRSA